MYLEQVDWNVQRFFPKIARDGSGSIMQTTSFYPMIQNEDKEAIKSRIEDEMLMLAQKDCKKMKNTTAEIPYPNL